MKDYFKDKVAIVTGGASGPGMEFCEELGRRGAKVAPVDINQGGAQKVVSGITHAGGEALSAYLDVTLYEDAQIVNIISLAGLIPVPKEIPYCTSKWAVAGFSNSLRMEGDDLVALPF